MAVLVDEEGKIASSVAAGAPALCWHWLTKSRTTLSRPNHASSIRTRGSDALLLCLPSGNTSLWSSLAHRIFSGEKRPAYQALHSSPLFKKGYYSFSLQKN